MDREKVIKGLEVCTSKPRYCTDCPYKANCCLDSQEVMEDALALLKEKEATTFKPHYIDKYSKHFICGVECGACHKEISSTYHYCPWCGRSVKWE